MPPAANEHARGRPVGVFDSGVGGLTVLHELLVALPQEDFLYLGDTARFPYGTRTPNELEGYALEVAEELAGRGAKLLVVACNSATSAAIDVLRTRFEPELDVIGVVGPETQAAVVATRTGRVGLLATPATVTSGAYERAVVAADPHVRLTSVPAPDLAPIIQDGVLFDDRVVATVRAYCEPLRAADVDVVILGCTHYPLVRPLLQRILGRGVTLVSAGAAVARRVESALAARGLSATREGEGDYRFLCTGDAESFAAHATRFLQLPLGTVDHIEVTPTREFRVGAPA
jgi:glutamate racemase